MIRIIPIRVYGLHRPNSNGVNDPDHGTDQLEKTFWGWYTKSEMKKILLIPIKLKNIISNQKGFTPTPISTKKCLVKKLFNGLEYLFSSKQSNQKIGLSLQSKRGFTLVEVLVVIAIIGILSSVVFSSLGSAMEKARFVKAKSELKSINEALELYRSEHNDSYPPDTNRDIPPGLEDYLSGGAWPSAPWSGSVFDWDNWTDPDTSEKIYQISIRFCPSGGSIGDCNFPNESWANDFDTNSSVFYCIEGACRPHINEDVDYPGYCMNCQENEYPYGIF